MSVGKIWSLKSVCRNFVFPPHSVSLILHIIIAATASVVAVFNLTFPFASKGETTKTSFQLSGEGRKNRVVILHYFFNFQTFLQNQIPSLLT